MSMARFYLRRQSSGGLQPSWRWQHACDDAALIVPTNPKSIAANGLNEKGKQAISSQR
jgi:hypothetical protein